MRRNGADVDRQIRERSGGLIWMENPCDYLGVDHKQSFIDNSYGEALPFTGTPGRVLFGGGAGEYRYRRISDSLRVHSREKIIEAIASCSDLKDFRVNHKELWWAAMNQPDYKDLVRNLESGNEGLKQGVDVDNQIREKHDGLVWMKNPADYLGVGRKQEFIDNRYGEQVPFLCQVGEVLYRGTGSARYKSRHLSESLLVYTREKIKEVILGCTDARDFRDNHASCYLRALKEPDFKELTASLSKTPNPRQRFIYRISDDASVYYGLTVDPRKRESQYRRAGHRCNPGAVAILKNGGSFDVITDLLPESDARHAERLLINSHKTSGDTRVCVNISKGGQLGATYVKWTKENILKEASLYKHRIDFVKGSKGAYGTALKNGWIEEACAHMKLLRVNEWDLEKIIKAVNSCTSRSDFHKRFSGAYQFAKRRGWIDEVFSQALHWSRSSSPLAQKEFSLSCVA